LNRSYFALFVALLIHILLLLLIWFLGTITPEVKQQQKPKENKIKVSLQEMPKRVEKVADKKEFVKKEPVIAPPMPKGSQLKEIAESIKKPPIKHEEKIIEQKSTPKPSLNQIKTEDKEEPKPKIEPLPLTKPYVTLEPKKEVKKDPLAWMSEDKSAEEVKDKKSEQQTGSNTINSDLKELYGSEFGKLTPGQQKYLIDNQEIMRRITQEILNRIARVNIRHDMNVNRTNIVEFYLHPNGDMTDFKFLQSSGYHILDTTTQETIEFAYSRYPRPTEKILVRYNVFYNLAR
jgi:TonB family protein